MAGEQREWTGFPRGFTARRNHARRSPGCTATADTALNQFDGNSLARKAPGNGQPGDSAAYNQDFHAPPLPDCDT
jgi:hypothetical protein